VIVRNNASFLSIILLRFKTNTKFSSPLDIKLFRTAVDYLDVDILFLWQKEQN